MTYEMPPRQTIDGPVSVDRPDPGWIGITVETNDTPARVTMSEYNAWRVFGLLSVMLGLPLSKVVSKAIKLSDDPSQFSATMGPATPLTSFGDKVAWHLKQQVLAEELAKQGIVMEPVALERAAPNACPTRDDAASCATCGWHHVPMDSFDHDFVPSAAPTPCVDRVRRERFERMLAEQRAAVIAACVEWARSAEGDQAAADLTEHMATLFTPAAAKEKP